MRADGHVHGVVIRGKLRHARGVHGAFGMRGDTAHGQDAANILVQALARETVRGDAVADHAAQLLAPLEHVHVVAHQGGEVRAGQTGRAAANDRHAAAGCGQTLRHGHLVGARVLAGELLDAADVERRVDERAAAALLAGMLAHQAARGGERIVLADHLHGAGVIPLRHQRDVGGHVHMRRAERLARHRLAHAALAFMLAHVAFNLGGEGIQAFQQGVRRLVADGAIRCVAHHLGQRAHALDLGRVGLAIHQMAQHACQLGQAVTARHAFAARLQRALLEQRQLLRQRAHARRHGVDATLLPVQEPADAGIVRRSGRNGQSRHFSPVSPAYAGSQRLHGDGNGTSRPIVLLVF